MPGRRSTILIFRTNGKSAPNLTLTYGLGWQVNTPQNDIFNGGVAVNAYRPGVQSTVYPSAPPGLLFPGDQGISDSTYGYSLQISLRVWDLRGVLAVRANGASAADSEFITIKSRKKSRSQNLESPPFSLTDFGAADIGASPSFRQSLLRVYCQPDASGNFVGATPASLSNRFPYYSPGQRETRMWISASSTRWTLKVV